MPATYPQISIPEHDPFSLTAVINRMVEKKKLVLRANKYKHKEDRGGIAYLCNTIKRANIVFDIGAHKGAYLYFMRQQIGVKGKVYAFEPQEVLYNYLQRTRDLLEWDNVIIERYAVSDAEGKATLFVPHNHGSESSPGATIIHTLADNAIQRTETVSTVALDLYCICKEVRPSFLKIDVEGNELNVFKGAEKLLKYHKPKILFECEARHVGKEKLFETLAFLNQYGYDGYFIQGSAFIPVSQFNTEKFQTPGSDIYCNNFVFE